MGPLTRTETQIVAIVAQQLDVPISALVPSKRLVDDLGADSLALAQLALALEERFDIDIPGMAFVGVSTLDDLLAYVARLVSAPDCP